MEKSKHYIGKVTLKSIRDFILDFSLGETDTIWLNPFNFDDIVLEYKDLYKQSLKLPFFYLSVLIEEDKNFYTPKDRIALLKDDDRLDRSIPITSLPEPEPIEEIVYLCRWCGNLVDNDGTPQNPFAWDGREYDPDGPQIKTISKLVNGKCCRDIYLNL